MKKTTLKLLTLILTVFAFQAYAQVAEGIVYTIRNVETGQYLQSPIDTDVLTAVDLAGNENSQLNWTFVPQGGLWNIVSTPRGILRAPGGALEYRMIVTNIAPRADSDKIFTLELKSGTTNQYRFITNAGNRWIYQESSGTWPVTNSDVDDNRGYWVVEESTLSYDEFDARSVYVSNPVNNLITIKGLPSSVNEISVYSLLGRKVMSSKLDGQDAIDLEVNTLTNGVYILDFQGDNIRFSKKIVKQ